MDHLSTNSSTIIIIIIMIISLLFNRALTTNRLKGYLMIKSLLYNRSVPFFVHRIIKRRRSGTTYSLRMHSPWIGVIVKSRNHRVSIRRNSFLNVKKVRALLKEGIVLSQRKMLLSTRNRNRTGINLYIFSLSVSFASRNI